jgi:hypothetical protein
MNEVINMLAKQVQIVINVEVISETEVNLDNTIKTYINDLQKEYNTLGKNYGFYGKVNILNVKDVQ